jgi:hypothetical protein
MRNAFAPRELYQPLSRAFRLQLDDSGSQTCGQGEILIKLLCVLRFYARRILLRCLDVDRCTGPVKLDRI